MKATKPASQQFGVYLLAGAMGVGNMKPVEGLTDIWQLTFRRFHKSHRWWYN